jgi:hypothetical protein
MATRLSRRTMLRGLGSVAIALPALEIMAPSRASADDAAPPKRFLVSFGGQCTGADGHAGDLVVPDKLGTGYDLKRGLASLGELDIAGEVSIVSGLTLPWGTGSDIPPGGKSVYYHYNTVGPQLSGIRTGADRDGVPRGPTADQVAADALAVDPNRRVLTYRIQAATYVNYMGSDNNTGGTSMTLSWRQNGDALEAVDPTFSPKLAYESLFTGFTPSDPDEAKKAKALLARRKSVLDLVDRGTARLLPKLGAADRQRMERHFDEIRALEERIATLPEVGGACALLPHPGEDPPIGGASSIYDENEELVFDATAGYSDEDLRGDILTDLICMAFTCDLYRSCSLLMTEWKCYMNMNQLAGWPLDVHGLTHEPNLEGVADGISWHVKQLGRLAKKLRDRPEVDGSTVLDHTAMVLLFEGGHGYDPEGGTADSSHSTENMVALIAGRAGGLVPGQHVSAPGKNPAQVVVSALDAVGVEGGLGEVTEGISELFG